MKSETKKRGENRHREREGGIYRQEKKVIIV